MFYPFHTTHPVPASDDDSFLAVPGWIVGHNLGVRRDVLGRELGQLIGLRVDPPERLHLFQVFVLRHRIGQMAGLMGTPLRDHHYVPDFFHLQQYGMVN